MVWSYGHCSTYITHTRRVSCATNQYEPFPSATVKQHILRCGGGSRESVASAHISAGQRAMRSSRPEQGMKHMWADAKRCMWTVYVMTFNHAPGCQLRRGGALHHHVRGARGRGDDISPLSLTLTLAIGLTGIDLTLIMVHSKFLVWGVISCKNKRKNPNKIFIIWKYRMGTSKFDGKLFQRCEIATAPRIGPRLPCDGWDCDREAWSGVGVCWTLFPSSSSSSSIGVDIRTLFQIEGETMSDRVSFRERKLCQVQGKNITPQPTLKKSKALFGTVWILNGEAYES